MSSSKGVVSGPGHSVSLVGVFFNTGDAAVARDSLSGVPRLLRKSPWADRVARTSAGSLCAALLQPPTTVASRLGHSPRFGAVQSRPVRAALADRALGRERRPEVLALS